MGACILSGCSAWATALVRVRAEAGIPVPGGSRADFESVLLSGWVVLCLGATAHVCGRARISVVDLERKVREIGPVMCSF